MLTRRHAIGSTAALLGAACCPSTSAQSINGAARVCVGFPAGSAADVVARLLATHMTLLGRPHVTDNRAGAGGRLAIDNIKQAAPDGSAMLVSPDAMFTIYPHVYRKLSYEPLTDLRPVSTLVTVPLCFAVGPLVPEHVRTLADFVQWAKVNPENASFGTSGTGTTLHFTGWMLAHEGKFELAHVPYRGSILALQDMVGGQVAASINVLGEVLPFAKAGKARILAVTGPSRSSFAAEVPTVREAGFPSLESMTWFGLFLPGKSSDALVASLGARAAEIFHAPAARETLEKMAMEPSTMLPDQFASLIRNDLARWGAVVKQARYTAEN